MASHDIDILCRQETKINHNSRKEHDSFIMYWSSGVTDDDRNKAEDLKGQEKPDGTTQQMQRHLGGHLGTSA